MGVTGRLAPSLFQNIAGPNGAISGRHEEFSIFLIEMASGVPGSQCQPELAEGLGLKGLATTSNVLIAVD